MEEINKYKYKYNIKKTIYFLDKLKQKQKTNYKDYNNKKLFLIMPQR